MQSRETNTEQNVMQKYSVETEATKHNLKAYNLEQNEVYSNEYNTFALDRCIYSDIICNAPGFLSLRFARTCVLRLWMVF